MRSGFHWYDLPSVRWANDLIWRATGLPGEYDRETDVFSLWHSSELLVTQACGLDLYLSNAHIQPIAAPIFDLDCDEGKYYSHIVGNRSGRVAAVNAMSSRSGLSALLTLCRPEELLITGSHVSSLSLVQSGQADVAAIDAVTWKILERSASHLLADIQIVDRTAPAPSPPFVVGHPGLVEDTFNGLVRAFESVDTIDARKALCLEGLIPAQKSDYDSVLVEYRSITGRIPSRIRDYQNTPEIG